MVPIINDTTTCFWSFLLYQNPQKRRDAVLAYVRSGTDCGEFLVDAGLIGRKLPDEGGQQMDTEMAAFIDNHLAANTCDPDCTHSNLADDVDMTSFLRNIAVYVGLLHVDSPLTQGTTRFQNFFLAYNGGLWSMVQWDHNDMLSGIGRLTCASQCAGKTVANWSILRPTCRGFETNQVFGPLLADPDLRGQYVEYLREFVNDVMTDDGFLGQIQAHLEAIKDDVSDDIADSFLQELAVSGSDEGTWLPDLPVPAFIGGKVHYTLLGMIRARATEIRKQLDAIDAGTFPRDLDDIAPEEECVDWTLDGPRTEGPTPLPTGSPTDGPTPVPTGLPTDGPTLLPTGSPTKNPTPSPTDAQKSNKSKASKSKASKSKTAKPAKPESVKSKTSKAKGAKGWFA